MMTGLAQVKPDKVDGSRSLCSNPCGFGILLRLPVGAINIHFPLKPNTLFPRVSVQNLLFEDIAQCLMPFETFVHPCFKQCLQPSIFISNSGGILSRGVSYHINS